MFTSLIKRVLALDEEEILHEIFKRQEIKIFTAELQRSQMYDDGVDSEGVTLGDYSEISVKVFDKPKGHIRVYDTGQFQRGIKIKVDEEIVITANTLKGSWLGEIDLLHRWKNLLGLNKKSYEKLREKILPLFIAEVRKNIVA